MRIYSARQKKYKKRENLKKLYLLLEKKHKNFKSKSNNNKIFLKKSFIADELDVDIRTVERYINFLITEYNMKIQSEYKKGYFLIEEYSGPPLWQDEMYDDEVILALILSERISTAIPDKYIKKTIKKTIDGLYKSIKWNSEELEGKISLKNTKYSKPDSKIFISILNALKLSFKTKIVYKGLNSESRLEREIFPLHLLLYMGSWHLIAFCEKRNDIRFFNLSRIYSVKVYNSINFDWKELNNKYMVKKKINECYGIFMNEKKQKIELKFDYKVKEIVKNLIWTPEQEIYEKNGNIFVKFFVADYREIKNDILSYGENVEVIKPYQLREEVKNSIKNMVIKYKLEI